MEISTELPPPPPLASKSDLKASEVGGKGLKTAQQLRQLVIEKKRKRKTQQLDNFRRYIYRVLKLTRPGLGISSKAMSIMNCFMVDMFERLASEAESLRKRKQVGIINSRDVQTATKLVLSGELRYHAVAEGTKAVAMYLGNAN